MEITAITPQLKDKTRCNIFVDGRFYCGMSLATTVKNRLKVGAQVDEEKLSSMQLESEKNTALDKALTHISATRKTEKQIRDFLAKKGFLPAVVDYVVEKMRGYDFLNDGEYATEYISHAATKKGARLIKCELRAKGVSERDVDVALESLDGETELAAATAILEKYLRAKTVDRETLQKAYRYLLGKGFDYDTAKRAIGAFGDEED
ncbi:MAG: hypothetical protein E7357_07855 [Clostridiales bacterium]|nr:hypothetical protein [Clostridiales bacterium]